ncbi:DASH family cryptochrome [Pseudidiomarina homiensis]|uniref:DASH family cryptochrome n=1 Tax=Pseudidiomarina homiensis TaxID=364198 RepID=UPI00215B01CD|nr:DASH family cryptochrome [Pseudidiomarina homiensis]
MTYRTGLIWLREDLRLDDNPLIHKAAQECEQLLFIYCVNPKWFQANRYGLVTIGAHRWRFLLESLTDLRSQLKALGQELIVSMQSPLHTFAELFAQYPIDVVYSSEHAGYYECVYQQLLQRRYPLIKHHVVSANTLFRAAQFPFALDELPASFSKFRRTLEQHNLRAAIAEPIAPPQQLPQPPAFIEALLRKHTNALPAITTTAHPNFAGGERAALQHLQSYFSSGAASSYKLTRNALDDWPSSTKLSPWFANGSLSVRRVQHELRNYEKNQGANESTYWIFFELLWREYFQWYAHKYDHVLFRFAGIQGKRPQTSFYSARWQQWCSGTTAYPLVNACMNQLNATGYMSNRGRQLVASCFVHELELDWRYGAAFFEQQLIDYDVASNWGNWQYLAGVGADPRGHRRFDLDKQTQQYDPNQTFIHHWQGDVASQPDWIDAADWPQST